MAFPDEAQEAAVNMIKKVNTMVIALLMAVEINSSIELLAFDRYTGTGGLLFQFMYFYKVSWLPQIQNIPYSTSMMKSII